MAPSGRRCRRQWNGGARIEAILGEAGCGATCSTNGGCIGLVELVMEAPWYQQRNKSALAWGDVQEWQLVQPR
jgi:NAD(P)H-nitrite reductase large subunit